MCFSASASFGAGIALSAIGVASIKKAHTPSKIAFASIPLLFSAQQLTEGLLWLALQDPAYAFLQQPTTYIFLFFAQILWPTWVPLSIFLLDKDSKFKMVQKAFLLVGISVSTYLGYCLLTYYVEAEITGAHIAYNQDYPQEPRLLFGALYLIATILPPFFSSIKKMWLLGAAILISYLISTIFYVDYLVSVWCFFASVISIAVLVIVYQQQNNKTI